METLVCDVLPFWSSRTVGTAPGHAAWLNNWRKRSSACRGSSLVGLTVSCVDYLNRLSQSFLLKRKPDVAGWWRYVLFINGASANQISSPGWRLSTYSIWQASRSHLQPVMEGSAVLLFFPLCWLSMTMDSRVLRATGPCRVHENPPCHLARCQSEEQYLTEGGDQKKATDVSLGAPLQTLLLAFEVTACQYLS